MDSLCNPSLYQLEFFYLSFSQLTPYRCGLLITSISSVTWRCLRAESLHAYSAVTS